KVEKEERSIDYAGSGLFFIAVSSLMVLFIEGGTEWEWLSGPTFILLTVFMIGMAAFLWREKKAFSPMMPLRLWQDKLVALANIASFTYGVIMIGLYIFLPTYLKGVRGRRAVFAVFTLPMMSFGWPLASILPEYIF